MSDPDQRPSRKQTTLAWILVLGAIAATLGGLAPPQPGVAAADAFSLERAKQDLAFIASEPRPLGSEHHARVRAYLLEELEDAGLKVELQTGEVSGETVTNLMVRIPGSQSTGAVLLMAHYDSVPRSPGAGDDGSGTVSVLESMRQLADSQPRNDVIGLFTDGEELGLLGAKLFAREHPWFESVEVTLNYEAIGNGGPCVMFETGPGSAALVELWAQTSPSPSGNSLAPVIYGWMPNDTDFSVVRDKGVRGLNFAIGGASGAYHSPRDTPDRLEDRSLAHMGGGALSLARELGELDLAQLEDGGVAYFTLPFGVAVTWGSRIHGWLAVAVLLVTALVAGTRGRLTLLGWLRGNLAALVMCAASGAAAFLGWKLAQAVAVDELPVSYNGVHGMLAVALLAGLLGAAGFVRLWSRGAKAGCRARELAVGGLTIWAGLFAFFFKVDFDHLGASYPFAVAVTCGGLALVVGFVSKPGTARLASAFLFVPTALILGPFLSFLVQLSTQDLPTAARLAAILIGLGASSLLPVLVTGLRPSQAD